MIRKIYSFLLVMMLSVCAFQGIQAQQRRPIDNQHPLWLVHVDVWNSADPQKIIDLIPADIKPYVCLNLSLSCQFDTKTGMYRMPRNAVRTYKSWATVCQQNNMWFSCQPASGGHTHIQDNDLQTFEYFFKTFPNFLGWNYAEQFWAFGDAGDLSSMTKSSRWNLFANLVEMSHKYGGFLTVSWCGGIYHFDTDPLAELKTEPKFLAACQKYPESILFLYKYTHCSSFYNNESVCFGPFIAGLTKNYGVRYDNCGYNDMLTKVLGEGHGKKYPGSAGIGTVMEQTCVNGGAVWDGPELIWTEDFQNLNNSTVDGYTRRNWGLFPNFKGIWLDMWREITKGKMYIPTRQEVVAKTKAVLIHDANNDFKVPDALYAGLYEVKDPGNKGDGRWENNGWYLKSSGRYGAIPMVPGLYDDIAKSIPVQVKKSGFSSRWGTQSKKVKEFNELYPEVSKGDLYVNRYRNQLVTYAPYTYLNKNKHATGAIPLQYNTCDSLKLDYYNLSSGVIREYADRIELYLNNYRSDTLTVRTDTIYIVGATAQPVTTVEKHKTGTTTYSASLVSENYDADTKTYRVGVKHMGPATITIACAGEGTNRLTDYLPDTPLGQPQQPAAYHGPVIIEAENMDYKSVNVSLTHSGWWAQDYKDFAGMGYVETQASTAAALRHQLTLTEGGAYHILVRYCNSSKAGNMKATVNGTAQSVAFEKVEKNDWREAVIPVTLKAGSNTFVLQNSGSIRMTIDQITYMPAEMPKEKFDVAVRQADFGTVVADVDSAQAGQEVHLTINADDGYGIKSLRVVNSVYFTQGKTIPVAEGAKEVTFIMPDENVTIQPQFYDMCAVYTLDFTDVQAGQLPEGWRTTDGSDVRNYPTSNSSGPRTFSGLQGYQGKALYWRTTSAEYGRLSNYKLTLAPGSYVLSFATAAWKGTPTYQARILKSTGSVIATSSSYTATPNLNGNAAGDISSAARKTLSFDITTKGDYVIQFKEVGSGMQEFLLAECRLRDLSVLTGITNRPVSRMPEGIYSPSGVRRESLQRGLNIVVKPNGQTQKVLIR